MMDWIIDFYKDDKGKEPVKDFLDTLQISSRVRVTRVIERLANCGVLLKEPYSRLVRGKIRELRVKDLQGNIRVLYFTFTEKRFILLHAFIKKTNKTPKREIVIAEKRMNDYIKRHGG
ncbi:MAG: type II toxin-antitoxin system RelE/ParE family toxin [Thermodesulfovibrionales bacterium]|nr:type II toxin-antitoxin system RelE/ParE family toxin [Thermodesulfovibrionales bacterium]